MLPDRHLLPALLEPMSRISKKEQSELLLQVAPHVPDDQRLGCFALALGKIGQASEVKREDLLLQIAEKAEHLLDAVGVQDLVETMFRQLPRGNSGANVFESLLTYAVAVPNCAKVYKAAVGACDTRLSESQRLSLLSEVADQALQSFDGEDLTAAALLDIRQDIYKQLPASQSLKGFKVLSNCFTHLHGENLDGALRQHFDCARLLPSDVQASLKQSLRGRRDGWSDDLCAKVDQHLATWLAASQ